MKIKDLVNELNKYDENTEVFVNDIEFDVLKDKFFLYGKVQPVVIRLIGQNDFKRTFIF